MTTYNRDLGINSEASEGPEVIKKPFVEPEVSAPIDVLEATAFFIGGSGETDVPTDFS